MVPLEDTEDCLGRITVGLTRSKSLTLLVSPLDTMGLMGMAQVIATIAGIRGLRRGETTWSGLTLMLRLSVASISIEARMRIAIDFDLPALKSLGYTGLTDW